MNCKLDFFFRVNLRGIKKLGGPDYAFQFSEQHLNGNEIVSNVNTEDDFDPEVWVFNYPLTNEKLIDIHQPKKQSYNFNSINVPDLINDFKKEPYVALFLNEFIKHYGEENIQVCFGALVYDQHLFE